MMTPFFIFRLLAVAIMLPASGFVAGQDIEWSAQEIRDFEARSRFEVLARLAQGNTLTEQEIELTPQQQQSVKKLFDELSKQQAGLLQQFRTDMVRAKLLVAMGKDEGKQIQQNIDKKFFAQRLPVLKKVEKDILLPSQNKRLAQMAIQKRMVAQLKEADPFLIPLVIAQELELGEAQISQIKELINEKRIEYYTKLEKKRAGLLSDLFKQLDQASIDVIKTRIGKLYDLESEKLHQLKSASERHQ